jgi:hypothetical protein
LTKTLRHFQNKQKERSSSSTKHSPQEKERKKEVSSAFPFRAQLHANIKYLHLREKVLAVCSESSTEKARFCWRYIWNGVKCTH